MDYFVAALHETGRLRQDAPHLMLEFCYAHVQYAGYSRRDVREAS